MSRYDFIQFAFTTGILAPNFHGRSDLRPYDSGLLDAVNFFVDVNGGIASRPGTKWIADLGDEPCRLWRFRVNSELDGSDYLVIFSDRSLRIFQDETLVYSDLSPYRADDLATLNFSQWRKNLIITHNAYQPTVLSGPPWSFRVEDTEGNIGYENVPQADRFRLTAVDYATGEGGVVYGISVIDEEGTESPIYIYHLIEDLDVTSLIILCWRGVANAAAYNVYRSGKFGDGSKVSLGVPLGLVGTVTEPVFTDTGIDPVYESPPFLYKNPFQPGAVTHVDIVDGGAGYGTNNTVGIVSGGGGTGLITIPVVDPNGIVVGERIIRGGRDYNDGDEVQFPGTDVLATGEVRANPRTGIFPRAAARFQQRRVYAGSSRKPMTLWASRIAAFSTFGRSTIPSAIDAFEIDLEAEEANPIKHLIPMSTAMLAFTAEEVFRVLGANGFSAETTQSFPLQFDGSADVHPLPVHGSLLYVENGGRGVRSLTPGQNVGTFTNQNRSILSNHLFDSSNPIVQWTYARDPHDVVWAVRRDGSMLSFTYEEEQGVAAWTRHHTGEDKFRDVVALQEGEEVVYLAVERGGRWFLEKFAQRHVEDFKDSWAVDAAVKKVGDFIVVDGLDHLEGRTVAGIGADGNPLAFASAVVTGGQVTLATHTTQAIVGLPWDGFVETLPIRSLQLPSGRVNVTAGQSSPPVDIFIRVLATQNVGVSAVSRYDDDPEEVEGLSDQTYEVEGVGRARVVPAKISRPKRLPIPKPQLGDEWSCRIYKQGPSPVFILGFDVTVDADPNAIPVRVNK